MAGGPKLPSGNPTARFIRRYVVVGIMTSRRITISEESFRALQAEGLVQGRGPSDVIDGLIMKAISPKAREALIAIGQSTATEKRKKSDSTQRRAARKPPLLDSEDRKKALIEMMEQPEPPTLEEMGTRLGGYDKGAVSRAISKLREEVEPTEQGVL